jgi:uncharacterized protein YbjT (DUF2867 family)
MKIVVIGGTGLIGSRLVAELNEQGHEALAVATSLGVDTVTGSGLPDALAGAWTVVDLTNSPAFDAEAALTFFEASTRNLLEAERAAGVQHHIALSIVGTDRMSESGYYRAKQAQEALIRQARMPYTIVRSTQVFEFLGVIADALTDGGTVRLPPAYVQPMAAADAVRALHRVVMGAPVNGTFDIAGPERFRLDMLIRRILTANGDPREVVTDPSAPYFGAVLGERTLVPSEDALRGEIRFDEWLEGRGGADAAAEAQTSATTLPE